MSETIVVRSNNITLLSTALVMTMMAPYILPLANITGLEAAMALSGLCTLGFVSVYIYTRTEIIEQ